MAIIQFAGTLLPPKYGTGQDGSYTVNVSTSIKDLYEVILGYGVGTYDPDTGAVPQFSTLTLNAPITCDGYLSTLDPTNGFIDLKVTGPFYMNASIDVTGLGYSGGAICKDCFRGGSGDGYSTGGGQGGQGDNWLDCGDWDAGGGAGGANRNNGTNGQTKNGSGGSKGIAYSTIGTPRMGSGGGAGGTNYIRNKGTANGGAGGAGGGIIRIQAAIFNYISGTLTSNGVNGVSSGNGPCNDDPGGGGGGAGGYIEINNLAGSFSTSNISISAGAGGNGYNNGGNGGAGGAGIKINNGIEI